MAIPIINSFVMYAYWVFAALFLVRFFNFGLKNKSWPLQETEVFYVFGACFIEMILGNLCENIDNSHSILQFLINGLFPTLMTIALILRIVKRANRPVWLIAYVLLLVPSLLTFGRYVVFNVNYLAIIAAFSVLAFKACNRKKMFLRGVLDLNFAVVFLFQSLLFTLANNYPAEVWYESKYIVFSSIATFTVNAVLAFVLNIYIQQKIRNRSVLDLSTIRVRVKVLRGLPRWRCKDIFIFVRPKSLLQS